MDQYISIDIYIPKLLEWLISRRHCQHEWQKEVVKIRAKINSALQDMPQNDAIANLLTGSYINYFHCLKIIEILRETEVDSKNIFGRYSSKRMKDWTEIVSLYSKNNIYLAEAADLLINLVKYEVPALKKQISKQQQLQTEFKKKESDAIKSAGSLKNEIANFLKELGLEGKGSGYRTQLLTSAKALTDSHEEIAKETKSVLPAVKHYKSFAIYSQPNSKIDMGLINHIAEKGNTTTYEWIFGEKPTKIVVPVTVAEETDSEYIDDGIDWGFSETSDSQIEVVDSGSLAQSEETIVKEEVDPNEKLAEGSNALSLLDNSQTRAAFVNQLLEVKAFLKGRLLESDVENAIETVAESHTNVLAMVAAIDKVLKLINNPTTQHYYNITHSPRYLDGLLKKIEMKEEAIDRAITVSRISKERAEEASNEAINISKRIQVIVKKSKELQEDIRKDISQRYSGRQVNLTGGAIAS